MEPPTPGYYTDDEQKSFLRYYLVKRLELTNKSSEVTDSMLLGLYGLCKLHQLVSLK